MYRFALRPSWLVSHVLVVTAIVVMILLAFWQLDRRDQRADRNALIEARIERPVVTYDDLVGEDLGPDEARYRRVEATGTYGGQHVVIDNRSLDGLPGTWVLTPLTTDAGRTLVVNRGFVSLGEANAVEVPPPPRGEVTVRGEIDTEATRRCAPAGSVTAPVAGRFNCIDVELIGEALGDPVEPVVLRLVSSEPAEAADQPTPVPAPELDAGPHLSYAVQWFIFASIALVGYPLVLRRVARQKATEDPRDDLDEELRQLVEPSGA